MKAAIVKAYGGLGNVIVKPQQSNPMNTYAAPEPDDGAA
jgi:hypothetical protein